jgi:hypothetical protein
VRRKAGRAFEDGTIVVKSRSAGREAKGIERGIAFRRTVKGQRRLCDAMALGVVVSSDHGVRRSGQAPLTVADRWGAGETETVIVIAIVTQVEEAALNRKQRKNRSGCWTRLRRSLASRRVPKKTSNVGWKARKSAKPTQLRMKTKPNPPGLRMLLSRQRSPRLNPQHHWRPVTHSAAYLAVGMRKSWTD